MFLSLPNTNNNKQANVTYSLVCNQSNYILKTHSLLKTHLDWSKSLVYRRVHCFSGVGQLSSMILTWIMVIFYCIYNTDEKWVSYKIIIYSAVIYILIYLTESHQTKYLDWRSIRKIPLLPMSWYCVMKYFLQGTWYFTQRKLAW